MLQNYDSLKKTALLYWFRVNKSCKGIKMRERIKSEIKGRFITETIQRIKTTELMVERDQCDWFWKVLMKNQFRVTILLKVARQKVWWFIQRIVIHYLDPTNKTLRWSSTIGWFINFCYKEGNEITAEAIDRKKN